MQRFGIDVSRWQGDFDFAKAKEEGIEFCILKLGGADGGLYTDANFEQNFKKCKALGIPVGVYFFSVATDTASAKKEAKYVLKALKGKQLEYPVYMDVEATDQIYIGARALTDVVKSFLSTVENGGWMGGIYACSWVIQDLMIEAEVASYTKWIASYTETVSYKCDMWQFGGNVNLIRPKEIAGVVCDQDYCYRDFPTEIKDKGVNGYMKQGWKLELKGWAYYENGKKVTKDWRSDTKGWCYLGKDGYIVKNTWQKDSKDWCYLGSDGYMVTNKWVQDSKGWCYCGEDGRIVRSTDKKIHINEKGYLEL